MSKVLLISSNTIDAPYPVYPLGMSVLAADLRMRGHRVEQFDLFASQNRMQSLSDRVATFQPEVVGISLRNVDNVDSLSATDSWHLLVDRSLVNALGRMTEAPLIGGGSAFSLLPEEALDYLDLDYGVVGEGEGVMASLIDDLAAGRSAPKIIRQHNSDSRLKPEIPTPLWSGELLQFYGKRSLIGVQSKRGCNAKCIYCTYPALDGGKYRYRDPGMVADEIEQLVRDYSIHNIFFVDSVFNDPHGHYLLLAEELIRRSTRVQWAAYFRPGIITASELRLLKRSGLYAIELGTDAATDETLLALGKPFSFSNVISFQQSCIAEKIPCAHYIIFGGPGETEQTVREGLRNIDELHGSVIFAFSGIRIFPGTGIYDCAIREGILASETSLLTPVFYFSPLIDPDKMNNEIEQSFRRLRERIFPPIKARMMMKALRRLGHWGLLWDKLISFN